MTISAFELGEMIQRHTRDLNATAIEIVDAIELDERLPGPFSRELRAKLEQLFFEGVSDARLAKAIDIIAQDFPELGNR